MSTPAAIRAWEGHFTLYRTIWRSNMMASFLQPLLYLVGMGLGVGALVDAGSDAGTRLDGLSYLQFMAPGLLATSAMMVAASEAMWPVMGGFRWMRTFHAAAATPLSPGEIAGGVALWHATKSVIAAGGVAVVLLGFDDTRRWGLVPAVLFAGWCGMAFSAPLSAWSATRDNDNSFPTITRFVITPMFLFGGAFYPISELPGWLQLIAKATPVWHGVELARASVNGRLEWGDAIAHTAYLAVFVVAGWFVARRTFARKLGG